MDRKKEIRTASNARPEIPRKDQKEHAAAGALFRLLFR